MRCHEAKHRLMQIKRGAKPSADDQQLRDHLDSCVECTRQAKAFGTLDLFLDTASVANTDHITPLEIARHQIQDRVEKQGRQARKKRQRISLGVSGLWRRSAYAAGVVMMAAMVVLVSLVPFGYYRTVGYDVSLAGVNMELALDDERMCDIFFAMGLIEATVDVTGCDTTCNLLVYDLKTAEEVQMVVSVFDGLSPDKVTTNITPVVTRTSGSLLGRSNEHVHDCPCREVGADGIL